MAEVRERMVAGAGGVSLRVVEGLPDGGRDPGRPPVVLVHGWPELAWSWRHQIPVLAEAGWHVLAPDMRGYGGSSCPEGIEPYRIDHLSADILAVADAADADADRAVFIGHDWGSMIVWDTGKLHPERCAGVMGMSVPFVDWPAPPTQLFEMTSQGGFFYILYFQAPGVAEAELEADVERSLRMTYYAASGPYMAQRREVGAPFLPRDRATTVFLDTMHEPDGPIPWLPAEDLAVFVEAFEKTGFRGGISYYRNLDADYEITKGKGGSVLTMPTAFVAGSLDPVLLMGGPGALPDILPDFRGSTIIDGAGHWVQQEAPAEVNAAVLAFLGGL